MSLCADDHSFGPVIGADPLCDRFDFTVTFEEAAFSIAPCVIALLIVPLRVKALWGRERVVRWPVCEKSKLILFVLLGLSQLGVLGLQTRSNTLAKTGLTLPADVLALITTVCLGTVSGLDGKRTLAPSTTIQTFLFFTTVFDVVRARTLWTLEQDRLTPSTFSVSLVLKILLLVLESQHKIKHAKGKTEGMSREKASGVFSRSLLLWLDPLIWLGNKKSLTLEDMYEVDASLSGRTLDEELASVWDMADQDGKNGLFWASMRAFIGPYLLTMIPNFALTLFTLLQPFLIERVIRFVQDPDQPIKYGYSLIGGYGVAYLGLVTSTAWNGNITARYITRIRGALISLIYRGVLSVRAETENSSAAMSLVGAEVERILLMQGWLVGIFPSIVQIVFAVWVLSAQLGVLSAVPVGIAVLFGLASLPIAKLVSPRQRQWMQAIQKRVGVTSDIFAAIRGVKMTGLSEKVQDQLQGLREFELDESKRFRRVQIGNVLMGQFPSIITPALTFAAFAAVQSLKGGPPLDVSTAFTSLSLLNILINPVVQIMMIPSSLASALACFERIQEFLNQEKRQDFRQFKLPSPSATPSSDVLDPFIQISNGSFGWSKDKPILKDVSMDIPRRSLTAIVGPVASGKSTLLKSLVGETYRLAGRVVCTTTRMGYCDQEPWILNQTIRENILAGEEYDAGFYDEVVTACQLKDDFENLPKGDGTVVGSQGASLSGGQKHRIALARAAYGRREVVILDDSLKGLDADTAWACFEALLKPGGLLRRGEQSVILATHNAQWLPFADQIIALNEEGTIFETGSYDQLSSNGNYITQLKNQGAISSETPTPSGASTPSIKQAKPSTKAKPPPHATPSAKPTPNSTQAKLSTRSSSSALKHYIQSLGKKSFPMFVVLVIFQAACRTMQRLWIKFWVEANEVRGDEDTGWWVGVYVLWGVLTELAILFEAWFFLVIVVPHSAKALHFGVLKTALAAPLSFFVETDVGEIVNRFSQDMRLIDLPLPISFMLVSDCIAMSISELVLTCLASGYLALTVPFLALTLYRLQSLYLNTSRQVRILEVESKAPLLSHLLSTTAGLVSARALSLQPRLHAQNLDLLDLSQRPFYMLSNMQHWLNLVLNGLLAVITLLLTSLAVTMRASTDPGLLGVALISVSSFGQLMGFLMKHWANLEESLGAVERVCRFEDETPREIDGPFPPDKQWPNQGAITFRSISAQYGSQPVLRNISLTIQPGQKVAICGRTGSGKTTLLSLLLRLHEPSAGTISVDGVDISTVPLRDLRAALAALPQDGLFLPGTVRANLDPWGGGGDGGERDGEMWDALRKTGLGELVEGWGGLGVELRVEWLSAGQRQLFCMARALLRRGRVLLLDEATSSLDHQTEQTVHDLLTTEFKPWTTLVIAHRLKPILHFDKVIVLQEGHVVEFDSPQNLLESGGVFSSLWKLQDT